MHEFAVLAAGEDAEISVDQFALGYWLIPLSLGISVLGATIGLACIMHSMRSVQFRLVWLASAALSLGGVGAWLSTSVAMLGLKVSGSSLRYDSTKLSTALVVAIATVFVAVLIIGRRPRPPLLAAGGLVLGLGIGTMHYLGVGSIAIQGSVDVTFWLVAVSAALGVSTATGILWSFQAMRFPLARVVTVVLFAVGMAATYYTALAALDFDVDPSARMPSGTKLFDFVFPMFVIGLLALTAPISAVLVAPDRREVEPVSANQPHQPNLEPAY
ncbi:MHYT domain-containing protein [Nocardia sp. CNY236]|uniref:MHYT domain-containing protein n=1 Tax=Nocardia sp. CNY236 TaxID=1169152 RepID=UPI0003FDDCD3|nr:MHYT domain-containing protein [Nocardia sp. CNY236]